MVNYLKLQFWMNICTLDGNTNFLSLKAITILIHPILHMCALYKYMKYIITSINLTYKCPPGICTSSSAHLKGRKFTPLPTNTSITLMEHRNLLLLKVYKDVVKPTLFDVFNIIWVHKKNTETLKDYLFRQISPPSNGDYNSVFNKDQREKIDKNPSCDKYDVSLLFASFSLSAEYNSKLKSNPTVADKLKDLLRKIKKPRNHIAHELLSVFEVMIDQYANYDLKTHMNDFLDLIGTIFGCKSATDARKILVQERIDIIMAIPKREYDDIYVYKLHSIIVSLCCIVLLLVNYIAN